MSEPEFVLAVDLDGTLLAENDRMHPADIAFLKHNPAIQLIIATGRPLSGVRRALELNHLIQPGQPCPYPLVLNNGAMQMLPGERLHQHIAFMSEVRAALAKIAGKHPEATFLFQGAYETWRVGQTRDGDVSIATYGYDPINTTAAEVAQLSFSKAMCLSLQRSILEVIEQEFNQSPVSGNFSLNDVYEVTPLGVDKAFGIERLLPALGLMDYPLVVAGDGENDVSMFATADYSFAPLNAHTHIRQIADVVFDRRPYGLLAPIMQMVEERALQGRTLREAAATPG